MEDLPAGYINNEINLDYYTVTISRVGERYEVYVGPVNPYDGGSAITVNLNGELELVDYILEILEPSPEIVDERQ